MSNDLKNRIFLGDNIDILRNNFPDNCIDLIYVDPPPFKYYLNKNKEALGVQNNNCLKERWCWNTNTENLCNELLYKGKEQLSILISFFIKFSGPNELIAYLVMIAERLIEMQRVLKSTGSIYFHCPLNVSFYIKLIMDAIFGAQQFRNEIIWCYGNKSEAFDNVFKSSYDVLLFYTKSKDYTFNWNSLVNSAEEEKKVLGFSKYLDHKDSERIFLRNPHKPIKDTTRQESTIWDSWHMPLIDKESNEYTGYPGQKPEALLERIINVSSNKGDLILDPFMGSGTTVIVSEFLNRHWVGIDISRESISILERRLISTFGFLGGG